MHNIDSNILFTAIDTIEKESFVVCDQNDDSSLSWDEVTACIVSISKN